MKTIHSLPMLELTELLWIALACFLTSIISSVAGFGGGFIIIGVFLFFFDPKEALALSNMIFIWLCISKWFFYRKSVDWEFVKKITWSLVPGLLVGIYFFDRVNIDWIKYYLAFIAGYVIVQHFVKKLPSFKLSSSFGVFMSGFLWGTMSGFALGGGMKAMVLRWKNYPRHLFIGTGSVISLILSIGKAPFHYSLGYLDLSAAFPIFIVAGVTSLLGVRIGKIIVDRISNVVFEYIVLIMLGVIIIRLLFF